MFKKVAGKNKWHYSCYIVILILAVKCSRLRQPAFGAIYPESCGQRKMPYRQRCAFACQPGFRLQGPSLRECILPGSWTGGTQSTRCIGKSLEYNSKLHLAFILLLFNAAENQATISKDYLYILPKGL